MYKQFKTYAVCQRCGRCLERSAAMAEGWLIAPHVQDPAIDVIRCWRHISWKALRNSYGGRTKHWIAAMYAGKERLKTEAERSASSILSEPFPIRELEEGSELPLGVVRQRRQRRGNVRALQERSRHQGDVSRSRGAGGSTGDVGTEAEGS